MRCEKRQIKSIYGVEALKSLISFLFLGIFCRAGRVYPDCFYLLIWQFSPRSAFLWVNFKQNRGENMTIQPFYLIVILILSCLLLATVFYWIIIYN